MSVSYLKTCQSFHKLFSYSLNIRVFQWNRRHFFVFCHLPRHVRETEACDCMRIHTSLLKLTAGHALEPKKFRQSETSQSSTTTKWKWPNEREKFLIVIHRLRVLRQTETLPASELAMATLYSTLKKVEWDVLFLCFRFDRLVLLHFFIVFVSSFALGLLFLHSSLTFWRLQVCQETTAL